MRALTRTTIGAALGSLAVLLVHPVSRPFVLSGFTRIGPSLSIESSPLLVESVDVLPQPKTVLEASIWMQEGARRLNSRIPISHGNLDALVRIADSAADEEPDNAFWLQMKAVFSGAMNEPNQSRQSWESAAKCQAWNDYQSSRFELARQSTASELGTTQAWQNAAFYYRRSYDCAFAINRFAKTQISRTGIQSDRDLSTRMVALQNGALLRDNSRAIEVGLFGVDIVESSSTVARHVGASPRKLITARYAFIDNLRAVGRESETHIAESVFLDNDAWLALLLKENPAETMREWSTTSILTASLPGALLVVSIVGYCIAAVGSLVEKRPQFHFLFRAPVTPIVGIGLSVAVYLATGLALFSLALAACFAFVAIAPLHERSKPPESFGPLFDFAVGSIAFLFSMFVAVFVVGFSTPAFEVAPFLNLPEEYFGGQTLPLGLALLVLSLLYLIAPLWAVTQRISTSHMVCMAIRNFGFDVGVLCSFLGIVSIPIAIYLDLKLEPNMASALMNEPTFYLTR